MNNYYSQYGQDVFLSKFFKDTRDGTFVDVGAYDGVTFSNTFYLEKYLNWSGLCIEPNPLPFDRLKNNRKSINVNCGIGYSNHTLNFLAVSGAGEMLSGFVDSFPNDHIERIDKMIGQHNCSRRMIPIPVRALSDVLLEHEVRYVHYCNIDVEGGELEVLKSIDFNSVTIKLFSVENNYGKKDVYRFLKARGYTQIEKIGSDEFYEYKCRNFSLRIRFEFKKMKKRLSYFKHRLINHLAINYNKERK